MPDNAARADQIEKAIDKELTKAIAVTPHGGSVFTVAPRSMSEVMEFAKLMSIAGICIRPMFRGNPGACLAVTLQAMKWGADPFAVANKAYEVSGQLSYESQLIHAIVNSSPALAQRLNATFSGEGQARRCLVVGIIRGEAEAREYESPEISEITPKNSPLWKTDPDQQLFYYATRAWARRWVPEVLLGIYTPEELGPTIDLTPGPEPRREDFLPQPGEQSAEPEEEEESPLYAVIDLDGVEHTFREAGNAEAALIVVLETAAKMGLDRLGGAWESNPAFHENVAVQYVYVDLTRNVSADLNAGRAPRIAARNPARARQAREAQPSAPETHAAATAPVAAPAASVAAPPEEQQFPGDIPPRLAPQLENESEPKSLAIAVPERRGQPDYRTWTIALFLPKVRQAKDINRLAFLVGDNEQNLKAARAALGKDDTAALDGAIDQRFRELDT